MIYTFYAYKGGAGRTMALANVAELFYDCGLRVVMVDWSLEAPSLEHYFPGGTPSPRWPPRSPRCCRRAGGGLTPRRWPRSCPGRSSTSGS